VKMRFLPDEPVIDANADTLGFGEFVDLVQTSIESTSTPFVHGILGDWGTGKTSIMRLLQARLNAQIGQTEEIFVPIWFNAWEYENEANIIYPLLYAIKRDYERRLKPAEKARSFFGKFAQVAVASALVLGDMGFRAATKALTDEAYKLGELSAQIQAVKDHPGDLEKVFSQWADSVIELHEAFEQLLDMYASDLSTLNWAVKAERIRFVILVDDLDRCLPETTIAVLESIKNHLTVKNCIFVLGLNARVVYQGIRIKYKGLEVDGREYLEKFLNYTFYVPAPGDQVVQDFVVARLNELVPDEADRRRFQDHFAHCGSAFKDCHFNNPRKIKRILNRYLLFISRYEKQRPDQHYVLADYPLPNIIRFIAMAEYFQTIFQLFLTDAAKAENARRALNFSKPEFDFKAFRETFGVDVEPIFPQLVYMQKLFSGLQEQQDKNKPDLRQQAQAVFSITRHV
jgi:hypothetical protein